MPGSYARAAAGGAAAMLLLVACSSSGGSTTTTSSTPVITAPTATVASAPAGAAPAATPTSAAAGSTGAQTVTVTMTDANQFQPATITVARGTTVTWVNSGTVAHTVTDNPTEAANPQDSVLPSGAQPWDSGNVAGGASFSHTFDTPGQYTYFCIPHESLGMIGHITVSS